MYRQLERGTSTFFHNLLKALTKRHLLKTSLKALPIAAKARGYSFSKGTRSVRYSLKSFS